MKFVKPSQLDNRNPGTWPIYYKLGLWTVVLLLIVFLYKNFFYEDIISQQGDNQGKISVLENQYKEFYQYKVDLPLYQARQKELQSVLLGLLKILPSRTEMPNLIDQIYVASTHNGLNFAKLIPAEQTKKDYYDIQPISLATTASFDSFRQFAEAINKLPRIVNLTNVNMTTVKEADMVLRIETNLETYIYNQDLSVFGIEEQK